MKANYYQLTS